MVAKQTTLLNKLPLLTYQQLQLICQLLLKCKQRLLTLIPPVISINALAPTAIFSVQCRSSVSNMIGTSFWTHTSLVADFSAPGNYGRNCIKLSNQPEAEVMALRPLILSISRLRRGTLVWIIRSMELRQCAIGANLYVHQFGLETRRRGRQPRKYSFFANFSTEKVTLVA